MTLAHHLIPHASRSNALTQPPTTILASCCRILGPTRPPETLKRFDPTGSVMHFTTKPFFASWSIRTQSGSHFLISPFFVIEGAC
jgi:hypothetical protein